MQRTLKIKFSRKDILFEFVTAIKFACKLICGNKFYNISLCLLLNKLIDDDFSNEIHKHDVFTEATVNDGNLSIEFVSVESASIAAIRKFYDYILDYYAEFDVEIEYNGKIYKTEHLLNQ